MLLLRRIALTCLGLFVAASVHADPATFDFKDPKGVNAITFFTDSLLEPAFGIGSGITGTITYDPADPTTFAGSISVAADRLQMSLPGMTQIMQGAKWLGISEHTAVTFTFEKVTEVIEEQEAVHLQVQGQLSLAGVTVPMSVPIQATFIPDGAAQRGGAKQGDLLVLRSTFTIDRKTFGLQPEMDGQKVGTQTHIMVAIAGYSK